MKLFEPIEIGGVTFKNRIYMPSMVTVGLHGPKPLAFYVERAKGGVAAISTQYIYDWSWILGRVEELKPLTDAVHDAAPDCKIAVQPGPCIQEDMIIPSGITSPSGAYSKATFISLTEGILDLPYEPREMTKEEIRLSIEKSAEAAVNLKKVGFDYIELHGSHAYLLRQFFSPLDNQRTDEYGGSLENRMRFPLETVRAIRAVVGNDFPIFYKLPAVEADSGGITLDESCRFAGELERAGVDAIVVTVGVNSHPRGYRNTVVPLYTDFTYGTFVGYAAAVKKWVNIPVIALGRINRPDYAEAILEDGKADMIGMGRQLIADPYWPDKVAKGQWGNVRPCLSCNACLDHHFGGDDPYALRCSVNPNAGLEDVIGITPAEKKKVLVVGGGPAGMEAAKTAALRGHDVVLCDESSSPGGMLIPASKPPHKKDIELFRRYQAMELMRTGVKVVIGKKVDKRYIRGLKPDALIVATGSKPITLDVPGSDRANVVSAIDVLMGKVNPGDKITVVGGGLVGCETAQFLVEQGKRVTIIEMLDELGADIPLTTRSATIHKLKDNGIMMEPNAKAVEFNKDGVVVEKKSETETISSDTIVLAVGMKPRNELAEELKDEIKEIHMIGDCVIPRRIRDAVHEGGRAGRKI